MNKCPYFGSCGGCSLQHVPYETQLLQKRDKLAKLIHFEDIEVMSDEPYAYRNRMDFIFSKEGLGLRKKGDWKTIIPITHCAIANEKVNTLLTEINTYFKNPDYFDIHRHAGTFKYAVIRAPQHTSAISFVLNEDSSKLGQAVDAIKTFATTTSAEHIIITYVPQQSDVSISGEYAVIKGEDMLRETFLNHTFEYSVQGFFQNNTVMAEKMQAYIHNRITDWANTLPLHEYQLLDLYGGVGTFGIINSALFKKTLIVENDTHCIAAAKLNIEKNKITTAQALVLDAMQIKKLELDQKLFLITDPPRSGMHQKTVEDINRRKPKIILYISCNIEELSKDIIKFKQYKLTRAALFDLFPQTPHVEAIVELVLQE